MQKMMNRSTWMVVAAVIAVPVLAMTLVAADKPAPAPKVAGYYAKLNLTPEQAAKVAALQASTKEQILKLQAAEKEGILAVLTAEQRAELAKMEAEKAAADALKAEEKAKAAKAAKEAKDAAKAAPAAPK